MRTPILLVALVCVVAGMVASAAVLPADNIVVISSDRAIRPIPPPDPLGFDRSIRPIPPPDPLGFDRAIRPIPPPDPLGFD